MALKVRSLMKMTSISILTIFVRGVKSILMIVSVVRGVNSILMIAIVVGGVNNFQKIALVVGSVVILSVNVQSALPVKTDMRWMVTLEGVDIALSVIMIPVSVNLRKRKR